MQRVPRMETSSPRVGMSATQQNRAIGNWLAEPFKPNEVLADDTHTRPVTMPGSGQWFRKHPAFTAWVKSAHPCALWVHGPPGCGKTNLANRVHEFWVDEDEMIEYGVEAIFFHLRNVATMKEYKAGTILHQMLFHAAWSKKEQKFSECVGREYDARCERSVRTGDLFCPTEEDCIAMLIAISNDRPLPFVLDGVEKCCETARERIIRALHTISTQCQHQPVKIMVFSHVERDMVSFE